MTTLDMLTLDSGRYLYKESPLGQEDYVYYILTPIEATTEEP